MSEFYEGPSSEYLRCLRTPQERIQRLQDCFYRVGQRLERVEQWLSALDVRLATIGDNLAQQQLHFMRVIERIESIKQGDAWPEKGHGAIN